MAIVSGPWAGWVSRRRSAEQAEPGAALRLAFGHDGHRGQPPLDERGDDRLELLAAFGELVQAGGDRWRGVDAGDQPALSHLLQPGGQQVGGDARQPVAQVGEPARPLAEQLADDQQHPAVAYRSSDRATAQYWL